MLVPAFEIVSYVPFTTEETNRYEELSKAQFADFYRTVAAPSKSSSFGQSNFLPSSSRLTDYSTAPSTSVFRSFAGDQEESQHSDCHRSDDGYGSNDSGFGSHSEDERNGEDHSNSGEMFYNILEDIPEPQQQHFDNITLAYQPYAPEENVIITQQSSLTTSALVQATTPSDEPSPVLGHYTENGPETLETTLELDEDDYLKYVTNQQVLEDISQSAAEQSFEAADEVLERIQRQHENSDVAVDFTPFDEPLPFLDDDFFLDVDEALIEAVAASNLNGTLSSTSGTSSSLSQSETPSQDYRLYGKLVPEIKFENDENEQDENEYDDGDDINSSDNKNHRRRGRQSKDNDLVKKHELPATAEELAAMSHKALQNLLKDPSLSDTQKSLIKRIRRRGRNKEAARKCRERRIMPSTSSNSGTSSPIKLEPPTTSTSDEKIVHRPFIIYPPTRSTKA
uniref:BZIP domain-containing protein n=1 Tax=Panagrolaimus superbus TaxID=310955 RepID=A0A914YYM4_9BILA